MNWVVETVGYGAIVPAAVAFALVWVCRQLFPPDAAARFALPVGLALGFFAGYLLVSDWAALAPQRHWQWLPYLGVLAAIFGPVALATRVYSPERWMQFLALALIAAFLLVPSWATMQPGRPVWIALLSAYFALLMALLDSLPERLTGPFFLVALGLAATIVAMLVAAEVSLVFGQLAGIATAALAGCYAAACFSLQTATSRGLIPVFVILVGGLAFVGAIEPEQPVYGMLLAPAAPLALWIFAAGPAAHLRGWPAAVAQAVAVMISLAIAAGAVFLRGASDG